jgi:hypothetical protein
MKTFVKLVVLSCLLFVGGRVGWNYCSTIPERVTTWWKGKPKVPTTALCHQILGELAVSEKWDLSDVAGARSLVHLPDRKLTIRLQKDWNGKAVRDKTRVCMNEEEIDSFEGDDLEVIEAAADPVARNVRETKLAKSQAELRSMFQTPVAQPASKE